MRVRKIAAQCRCVAGDGLSAPVVERLARRRFSHRVMVWHRIFIRCGMLLRNGFIGRNRLRRNLMLMEYRHLVLRLIGRSYAAYTRPS
jgi:hypothetical protein